MYMDRMDITIMMTTTMMKVIKFARYNCNNEFN
jgi:hypothetical protein